MTSSALWAGHMRGPLLPKSPSWDAPLLPNSPSWDAQRHWRGEPVVAKEVCQAWNISRAARCLPRDGGTRIVQPRKNRSHVCRLAGISKERKRWWDMVVSLRIACALVLWIMGCRFLCFYSITPEVAQGPGRDSDLKGVHPPTGAFVESARPPPGDACPPPKNNSD